VGITFVFFIGFICALLGVVPPGLLNMTAAKISLKEGHTRGIMFALGVCVIVFLSSLNVFPIPYQAYLTITFASFGWLTFNQIDIISYVCGATTGTFVMLYIYMFFFDKIKGKSFTSQKNMNLIIGSITGIITLVTLYGVIKDI